MRVVHIPRRAVGSPAWAGIDLRLTERNGMVYRFPRVGGDRPSPMNANPAKLTVPPRGRG